MTTIKNGNGKNGNGEKRTRNAERIIAVVPECRGLLSLIAKRTGLGYRTVCRYAAEFPSVAAAMQEARESMIDLAEAKLYQKLQDGDTTMIIFFLKTQGRSRGYVERQEWAGVKDQPMEVNITVTSPKAKELVRQTMEGHGTD